MYVMWMHLSRLLFFFNATATTEIYTLSLHDALPICSRRARCHERFASSSTRRASRCWPRARGREPRSEEHTSELQSHSDLVCRLLLEKKKKKRATIATKPFVNEPQQRIHHASDDGVW